MNISLQLEMLLLAFKRMSASVKIKLLVYGTLLKQYYKCISSNYVLLTFWGTIFISISY